jgi:hypothetical protein
MYEWPHQVQLQLFFVSIRRNTHKFTAHPNPAKTKKSHNANKETQKHTAYLSETSLLSRIPKGISKREKTNASLQTPQPIKPSSK